VQARSTLRISDSPASLDSACFKSTSLLADSTTDAMPTVEPWPGTDRPGNRHETRGAF